MSENRVNSAKGTGMASWRRKVLTWFPELRHEAVQPDYNIYDAFFELLVRVREAHQTGETEQLRRIYGFAEWCSRQHAKDLWNAAGVAFYEHLFDGHRSLWPEIVQWLSPKVTSECMGLWACRLPAEELAEVQRLIGECRRPLYNEASRLTARTTLSGH